MTKEDAIEGESEVDSSGLQPLRPKARILKTLGEELISSETVALIELVKNAYDADAKNVLISFQGNLVEGDGSVTVMDDGHGMDMTTIYNSWMIIATSDKKNNTISKKGNRRVLGEKGIGRFAASRIAEELELYTRTEKQVDTESYAFFDWTQFNDDAKYLDQILFLAEEQQAEEITPRWKLSDYSDEEYQEPVHGTALKMNKLRNAWETSDLEVLQRGLSRLLSPFYQIDDFTIYLDLPKTFSEFKSKVAPPEIIKYPHYMVEGHVEKDGSYRFSVSIESLSSRKEFAGYFYKVLVDSEWILYSSSEKPSEDADDKYRPIECGPFSFELRVWDRDELDNVNQKVGGGIRSVRKDLDSIAGINIYRDGFRVFPYGEPDNDWLRLDIRRVQAPTKRLSNNQITGYISISADDNPRLQDRSNREGLDNNAAYYDLQDIMRSVLNDLENVRYISKREPDSNGTQDDRPGLFDKPNLNDIIDVVKDESRDKDEVIKMVSKAESDWKNQLNKIKGVLSQYHALATLGGIVDKILHDGRQPLGKIQSEAGLGLELAQDLGERSSEFPEIKEFEEGFEKIVNQASILRDVFGRAEPFGGRKRGRPKQYYIEALIEKIFKSYEKDLKQDHISVELPDSETLVRIDTTEFSEIIVNLLLNSIHWLKSVPESSRTIKVSVDRINDGALEIIFSDSGPGVEAKYRDEIFKPYVSRKSDGHGLGLSLVGEIVHDYYNGSVELLDTGRNGGAAFRIILRKRV